jgi:hypothetical protein
MSELLSSEWREFFCKVLRELDPTQRTKMLQEIGRMLRNDRRHDIHRFGSLSVDIGSGEVNETVILSALQIWSSSFFGILLSEPEARFPGKNYYALFGATTPERLQGLWICMSMTFDGK